MIIKSNDSAVEQELIKLKDITQEAGAWLCEDLQVICEDGQVSLKVEAPVADIDVLIKLPEELLIPIDALNLTFEDGRFLIAPDRSVLSSVQVKAATCLMVVYNLLNRAQFHQENDPWILYKNKKELLEPFIKARSPYYDLQQRLDYFYDKPEAMSESEFLCWVFLKTNVLGHANKEAVVQSLVLMPFLTFFNHHYRGTPFFYTDNEKQQRCLCAKGVQPHLHKSECFASYGLYDGLDSFFHHGYIDNDVPYIRSVPINFNIDGHGELVIHSNLGKNYARELPEPLKDLAHLMPLVEQTPDGGVALSYLIIPSQFSPHALRRILRFVLSVYIGKKESPEFVIEQVHKLEKHIIDTNIKFYKDILNELEKKSDDESLVKPLQNLAEVQLSKLYKYHFNPEFFKR